MAVQASLGKNFIMNILLAASSLIFPLITYPYVSRILLPDGTGRVAFAVSVVSYFTMTASLEFPPTGSAPAPVSAMIKKDFRRQFRRSS